MSNAQKKNKKRNNFKKFATPFREQKSFQRGLDIIEKLKDKPSRKYDYK